MVEIKDNTSSLKINRLLHSYVRAILAMLMLGFSCNVLAEWIEYSTSSNGDTYFFDTARVEKDGDEIRVWSRVRYKSPVMAASSYQSFLKLDCADNSEAVLQSTFFIDKNWSKPAMATNTHSKPEKQVEKNSATDKLIDILCKD